MANSYLSEFDRPVVAIVRGIDRDVERGEDILMLGFGLVLMAPILAPLLAPKVLLPLMALAFAISSTLARRNFGVMQQRLALSMMQLADHELAVLRPIADIFIEHPRHTLTEAFNPLKNPNRTVKSIVGGCLINPLWMPVFYMMGIQFIEEKQLSLLNRAVMAVESQISGQ
ncbi:MAG: hypothetical protein ACXWEU_10645 [Methylomonas sp.]